MSVKSRFILHDAKGNIMRYTATHEGGKVVSVRKEGAHKDMSLVGGKRLYNGAKSGYAFADDIWGKAHRVTPEARKKISGLSKAAKRRGENGYKQKLRKGGRPTTKPRKKNLKNAAITHHTEQIIHRIQTIRNCNRKEAFSVYQYLKTICGGQPPEDTHYGIVKISRSVTPAYTPITWVFIDLQSPDLMFSDDIPDNYESMQTMMHDQLLKYIEKNGIPVNYMRSEELYNWIIARTPDISVLEDYWSTYPRINTDYMVFIGCAADNRS